MTMLDKLYPMSGIKNDMTMYGSRARGSRLLRNPDQRRLPLETQMRIFRTLLLLLLVSDVFRGVSRLVLSSTAAEVDTLSRLGKVSVIGGSPCVMTLFNSTSSKGMAASWRGNNRLLDSLLLVRVRVRFTIMITVSKRELEYQGQIQNKNTFFWNIRARFTTSMIEYLLRDSLLLDRIRVPLRTGLKLIFQVPKAQFTELGRWGPYAWA